jgi:Fe-S cluster assembly protein SufD
MPTTASTTSTPSAASTDTTTLTRPTDPYLARFERFEKDTSQPLWLSRLRKAGIARFAELGFPTTRHEDWRFTNLAPLAKLPFKPVFDAPADAAAKERLGRSLFAGVPGPRLVFVNGRFSPGLSGPGKLPDGVRIGSLASALASDPGLLEKHLGRYVRTDDQAFAALNTAFFLDGGFIHVPDGVTVPEPVQLVYISTVLEAGAVSQPRNLVIAGKGSRLTVVESHLATGDAPYWTNAVTELAAGDAAVVEHVKLQDESREAWHIATIRGRFGRGSRVNAHSFALGARLSRNNIYTELAGDGLECILNGLYLTRGDQLADHHMVVEHAQPNCASHEYFNGILKDKSRGVFHGRILVQPVAQKTDAKQTNKNILLSDQATVDTKPQLEIYADDVKCTHGATVGQLNGESVYYLRSRGIGLEMARQMLIHSFAGEIIDRVKCDPVREALDRAVWERLESMAASPEGKTIKSH